jgi:hypothetical protein
MMVIPEIEMIGAHSATKSDGVILIIGDKFLKSDMVSRSEINFSSQTWFQEENILYSKLI